MSTGFLSAGHVWQGNKIDVSYCSVLVLMPLLIQGINILRLAFVLGEKDRELRAIIL